MEAQSDLQQRFPLSAKKYWKKMLSQIAGAVFLGLFIGVPVGFFVAASGSTFDFEVFFLVSLTFLGVIMAAMIIPYSIYIKAYIRRYYYAGEQNFITIKKGVFAPTEIHVQYQKIQDVYVDQDVLDRIMGLYDVHIASATASSGIEAHIDGVEKEAAEGLKLFFLSKMSGASQAAAAAIAPAAAMAEEMVPANAHETAQRASFPEEISSARYPLSEKWIAVALIGRVLSSFFTIIVFGLIFVSKAHVSLDQSFGGLPLYLLIIAATLAWSIASLFLWKKNYKFEFTPEHIYYRSGVISLAEKHMPYSSIQDVTVKQSFINRMFGLAEVVIENAATQTVATRRGSMPVFTGVILAGLSIADANKITDMLKGAVLGRNTSKYGL